MIASANGLGASVTSYVPEQTNLLQKVSLERFPHEFI